MHANDTEYGMLYLNIRIVETAAAVLLQHVSTSLPGITIQKSTKLTLPAAKHQTDLLQMCGQ